MTIEPTENGKRIGRPTKLTPHVQEEFVKALLAGCYIETAAAFVGIHKDSYHEWLHRGATEKARVNGGENGKKVRLREKPYVDFSDAISHALAESEVRDVALLTKAGLNDWRAIVAKLERRYPERWGLKGRLEVTGAGGGPVEVTLADLAEKAAGYTIEVEEQKALTEGGDADD